MKFTNIFNNTVKKINGKYRVIKYKTLYLKSENGCVQAMSSLIDHVLWSYLM